MENNLPLKTISYTEAQERDRLFRRKLAIASRIIALFLILVLAFIGYSYYKYGALTSEKGSCYMCGLETLRVCSCQTLDPNDVMDPVKSKILAQAAANKNAENNSMCAYQGFSYWNKNQLTYDLNISNNSK
jgi:hypothetical protein